MSSFLVLHRVLKADEDAPQNKLEIEALDELFSRFDWFKVEVADTQTYAWLAEAIRRARKLPPTLSLILKRREASPLRPSRFIWRTVEDEEKLDFDEVTDLEANVFKVCILGIVKVTATPLPSVTTPAGSEPLVFRSPEACYSKTFAVTDAVDRKKNFYVEPTAEVSALKAKMMAGNYISLWDLSQTGKSTLSQAVVTDMVAAGHNVCRVMLNETFRGKGIQRFLGKLSRGMYSKYPVDKFKLGQDVSEEDFMDVCKNVGFRWHLIIDEASVLDGATIEEEETTGAFLSMLRSLKDDKDSDLQSVLLLGVPSLGRLLARHATKSFFAPDLSVSMIWFGTEDVVDLLRQFNEERQRLAKPHLRKADVPAVAADIYSYTLGYKGLTSVCMQQIEEHGLTTMNGWRRFAQTKLLGQCFRHKTLRRMWTCLSGASVAEHKILGEVLRLGSVMLQASTVRDLQTLVDFGLMRKQAGKAMVSGMLEADMDSEGVYVLSSPLLAATLLQKAEATLKSDTPPPNHDDTGSNAYIHATWLFTEVVRNLSMDVLSCKLASNRTSPSEYVFQYETFSLVKALISKHYAGKYLLVPEARQVDDDPNDGKLRLDLLCKHEDCGQSIGLELMVEAREAALQDHVERAQKYGRLHSAKVYVIHYTWCTEKTFYKYHCSENVTVLVVVFSTECTWATIFFPEGPKDVQLIGGSAENPRLG